MHVKIPLKQIIKSVANWFGPGWSDLSGQNLLRYELSAVDGVIGYLAVVILNHPDQTGSVKKPFNGSTL